MIRTMQPQLSEEENPLEGILAAVAFGTRATFHTTLEATPAQLVFGRDAILNIRHEADWNYIKTRKQKLINYNNAKENSKRKEYAYATGQKVLVENSNHRKFGEDPFVGPYTIAKVNDNGTVQLSQRLTRGQMTQTWNIRKIKPYQD